MIVIIFFFTLLIIFLNSKKLLGNCLLELNNYILVIYVVQKKGMINYMVNVVYTTNRNRTQILNKILTYCKIKRKFFR